MASSPRPYLTRLWCDLLHVDTVHPDDDFFRLGGHSMLAVRMLVGVVAEFQCDLDYDVFFSNPTLATLLTLLGASTDESPT